MWNAVSYFSFPVLKITSEKKHVHLAFQIKFSSKFQELMAAESLNAMSSAHIFRVKGYLSAGLWYNYYLFSLKSASLWSWGLSIFLLQSYWYYTASLSYYRTKISCVSHRRTPASTWQTWRSCWCLQRIARKKSWKLGLLQGPRKGT